MNAPLPNQMQGPPGGMPPETSGSPGAYPSGAEALQGMGGGIDSGSPGGAEGEIENPVLGGIRAILMFAKKLKDMGDSRFGQLMQHVSGIIQTMQGAPQDIPVGEQALSAGGPQPPPAQGGPAGMSPAGQEMPMQDQSGGPEFEMPPPGGPGPQGMAFNPFEAMAAPPQGGPAQKKGGIKPMQKVPQQPGKRPVVLT